MKDIGTGNWDLDVERVKYKRYGHGVNLGIEVCGRAGPLVHVTVQAKQNG
jgi:hypothetical protein